MTALAALTAADLRALADVEEPRFAQYWATGAWFHAGDRGGWRGIGWAVWIECAARSWSDPETVSPEERAAFIDAYVQTLPPDGRADFPNAARQFAESVIEARGPGWHMWRAGRAYRAAPVDEPVGEMIARVLDREGA
ncbi:hypothetical protein [Burkholderia cenocepacia]|uniref:hypothetical protein n=1 Tax=Burkholderia cenocepacia TaxID=95486 RepID=UPI002ABDB2BE|nr:hypothetical protein [Burkholderia cenocepacia]